MNKVITIVDAPGYIYRAWHATQPLHTSTGIPVNAAYGFTRMMLKMINDLNPTHLGLCFDLHGRRGRQEIYPEYKSNRPPVENDLSSQMSLIKDIVKTLNIPILECEGWEADDVAAAVVKYAKNNGHDVIIVTSDKDFIQLMSDNVKIYDPVKSVYIDSKYVLDRYGIKPEQMVDYQSLIGDSTDNVPKVPNIGPKTAAKLLNEFGTVDNIILNSAKIAQEKIKKSIADNISGIMLARKLVRFNENIGLEINVDSLAKQQIDDRAALALFKKLEFKSIINDLWGINMYFNNKAKEE